MTVPEIQEGDPVRNKMSPVIRNEIGLEAVVMIPDGIENLPDEGKFPVDSMAVQMSLTGQGHGKDDRTPGLAGITPHHPSDRLQDIDLAFLGIHEQDGIKGGNVHSLGQATGIGEKAYFPLWKILPDPIEAHLQLFPGAVPGIEMPCPNVWNQELHGSSHPFGTGYGTPESHAPLGTNPVHGQSSTDHPAGFIKGQFPV